MPLEYLAGRAGQGASAALVQDDDALDQGENVVQAVLDEQQ